ncbi:hypothetical protein Sulac_2164 [Sulfobacillus acidophilus DSM 10332]|uniref:Peptidase M24 domain-containing protein n=1 Tax=Sulfobacillus acidophilus (strain ATCC 700253 / DSM 10332 / NAL) TaxID=679936 RepID=G8TTH8_SULAD|nr:hypothetical protein Sulac_2164 [Sulfobacillus acidophilus DSM 10332]
MRGRYASMPGMGRDRYHRRTLCRIRRSRGNFCRFGAFWTKNSVNGRPRADWRSRKRSKPPPGRSPRRTGNIRWPVNWAFHALTRGVEPIVNLVGGNARRRHFRHVMPTDTRVGQTVILSLGGRYRGLVLSATRMVHFDEVSEALEREYDALCRVATAMAAASIPGESLATVWERTVTQYAREGYPDQWQHHHQGGVAGYRSREIRMRPDSPEELAGGYLVAWNPTLPGIKVEDTALLDDDGGWRWLTRTAKTPICSVEWGEKSWEWADIIRRTR